jgi:hypothetical protein
MKDIKEFIQESLRSQEQLKLFNEVISASDVEVKLIPKQGAGNSVLRIRAKSVNKNYIFAIEVGDITMTNISASNVTF